MYFWYRILRNSPQKLAFAGCISSTSINKELVKFVLKSFSDHDIKLIDLSLI